MPRNSALQDIPLSNWETSNLDKYCITRGHAMYYYDNWVEWIFDKVCGHLSVHGSGTLRLVRQFGRYSVASARVQERLRNSIHAPTNTPLLLTASPPLQAPTPSGFASAVTTTATTIVVHHHRHYHHRRYLHHRQQPPLPSPPRSPSTGAREAKGPEVSALRVSWPTWAARVGAPGVYPLLTANPAYPRLLGRARAPPVKRTRGVKRRSHQFVPVGGHFWRTNYGDRVLIFERRGQLSRWRKKIGVLFTHCQDQLLGTWMGISMWNNFSLNRRMNACLDSRGAGLKNDVTTCGVMNLQWW